MPGIRVSTKLFILDELIVNFFIISLGICDIYNS